MFRRLSAMALVACAGSAQAQLVIGNDQTTPAPSLWMLDLSGSNPPRELLNGTIATAWGLAADDPGQTLYWNNGVTLVKGAYTPSGPLAPVTIGSIRLGSAAGATTSVTALAFDTVLNKLYGFKSTSSTGFPVGIYEIDTSTAIATLAISTGGDLGGLDYDAATDAFYAYNDSTSATAPLSGRGIYKISKPIGTATFTRLAAYPGTEADIDGCAVGNGRVYGVNDVPAQGIYVYNIATNAFETTIVSPFTGTNGIFSGGAWAAGLNAPPPPGANLSVSLTDITDCSVPVGSPASQTITVGNIGPDPATGLVCTITAPLNSTSISSVPAGSLVGNVLTVNLGTLAASGSTNVTLSFTPSSGSTVATSVSVAANEPDAQPANNSASQSAQLMPVPPSTANAIGIITNIAAASNSSVPDVGGRFSNGITPGVPVSSPDGSKWIMAWDTDLATSVDQVLVMHDSNGLNVVVQEETTQIPTNQGSDGVGPPYFPLGSFDAIYDINDNGDFIFSGIDSRTGTADDGYIVKFTGGSMSLVSQEAITPGPVPGSTTGSTRGSAQIAQDGTAAAYGSVTGLTTTTDTMAARNNLTVVIGQEGVTVPTGQVGGETATIKAIDAGSAQTGVRFNADHSSVIWSGTLNSVSLSNDRVAVVNNGVVVQEGVATPGFSSTVTTITAVQMSHDGSWSLRASNADGQDFVMRDGAVVAQTGSPIFAGSTELFSDVPFATCFYLHTSNNAGDDVIGGTTNAADGNANAVVVLNNETVLLRENDPIDLDGNGLFDDNVYLRTFIDDRAFMTNDSLYIVVRLRDQAAALCGGTDTDLGQALIRIALPGCPCVADFDGSGGTPGVEDIDAFFAAWLAGDPSSDSDCSGGTPGVEDIDVFFSEWLAGGC